MIGLDTNVLVRYVVEDDPVQARAAAHVIAGLTVDNPGFISAVALAEFAWVLLSRYHVSRTELVTAIEELLAEPRLRIQDADAIWRALDDYDLIAGVDFSDALIAATGLAHGATHTLTFDRKAARLDGMRAM